ncbi:SMC family ATPase [Candidatus Bathyarchaeota archaeon]|nr:SMC family ATPase [Candidatus Bathyarchaeota archaeon]
MILKSLHLKNIRSYENLDLDFKLGTSLFEGDIGSGKSTILMGIEFSLFGLGNIRGNSLLKIGKPEGVVRLKFTVDGLEYEIQRKLVRAGKRVSQAGDSCYIKTAGGKLPLAPSELKQKVLEILNFNEPPNARAKSVIFTYAVFTPQEEMKSIITDKPEQRLQTLRKAFRIEDYKIAHDNASILYKEIDKRAERLEGAATGINEDELQNTKLHLDLGKEKKKIKPLEEQEQKETKERKKIRKELEEKRKLRLELTKVAGKIPTIQKQIDKNQKEIERLTKVIRKSEEATTKLIPNIDTLKNLKRPTDKAIEKIEFEIKTIENKSRTLQKQEGALESKVADYIKVKENGICPTCDTPANPEEFTQKINVKDSALKLLNSELESLGEKKNQSNKLLRSLREYEKAIANLDGFEDHLATYIDSIKQSKEQIGKLAEQIKEDQDFVVTAKEKHDQLRELEGLIKKLRNQDESKESTIKSISKKLSTLEERIIQFNDKIKELDKNIKQKKQFRDKSNKLKEYVTWIRDYFIPTIETVETSVLASINEQFNEKFREWFSMLVDDATKYARIDEDFTPIIEQDGYEQDLKYLSGGEKTSVALAYRLALNSLVQQVSVGMKSNLLILDEPTDGFSKPQLNKVRDILNELKCPQVILVSHEKELESFADHIYKIVKTNGISKIIT